MKSKCLVLLTIFLPLSQIYLLNQHFNESWFASSMRLHLRTVETMQELALRLLFCVTSEFSQGDVGTLLVLTPKGTL